jgi:hypothetical protein
MQIAGLTIDVPADLTPDQAMLSLRAPSPARPDPRVLQKQTSIRTSFIVHRRDVGAAAELGVLAGEVMAEFATSIAGLSALTTESLSFIDGAPGIIVSFDFGAVEVGTARQFHALRKDGSVLSTLTLTVDKLTLNEEKKAHWFSVLSSAVPNGQGALS